MVLHTKNTWLILALWMLWSSLNGQQVVSGTVTDKLSKNPLERASVYIDGTTNGTYTAADGSFKLQVNAFPCRLIVSYIGYHLLKYELKSGEKRQELPFQLNPKSAELGEITIKSKTNLRKKNLKAFSEAFLGTDKWGRHARILNDSVLYFSRTTDTLHVNNNKSIEVDLSLTGYTVLIDIEKFDLISTDITTDCDLVIHYRFIPKTAKSNKESRRFEQFRQEAYYNSQRHFLRSVFERSLDLNGYLPAGSFPYDSIRGIYNPSFEAFECTRTLNEITLCKLNKRIFTIRYFTRSGDTPLNLRPSFVSKRYNDNMTDSDPKNNSIIQFKTDSCIIRRDGTMPFPGILFIGKLADKRVGALIPDQYNPPASTREEE